MGKKKKGLKVQMSEATDSTHSGKDQKVRSLREEPPKRGRKPLGGLRIILRLTPQEVQVLDEKHQQTGHSRTDLIRRAIDAMYFGKRRESDWNQKS